MRDIRIEMESSNRAHKQPTAAVLTASEALPADQINPGIRILSKKSVMNSVGSLINFNVSLRC
ncbi:Protein of unknown function [Cotesia congregata]|uniref:Uncharacterized protein n=1 Tax=Cotesia congregata TaxID=51543 RepID=A0A8J2HBX7_COTCN|nr:Protein of unknown function [Cotesia congregata]